MIKQSNDSEKQTFELVEVDPNWGYEDVLSKKGFFRLDEIARIIHLNTPRVKADVDSLEKQGVSPLKMIGVARQGISWFVDMPKFASYYRENPGPRLRKIKKDWDGNDMVCQRGVFYLKDVCKLLPFTTNQLRYRSMKNPNSKKEYGIWKDDERDTYVVDMEIFGPWISNLWVDIVGSS